MESVAVKDGDESIPHFVDKSKLVAQVLEIESESWLMRISKNSCVGDSVPPQAANNLNSLLVGLFYFMAWQG